MQQVLVIFLLLITACTPLEDGGRWQNLDTEVYELFEYNEDTAVGDFRLAFADIPGRGVGTDFFLRPTDNPELGVKYIAWVGEGDVVRLTLPVGVYTICLSTARDCRSVFFQQGNGIKVRITAEDTLCTVSEKIPWAGRDFRIEDCSYIDTMSGIKNQEVYLNQMEKKPIPY